MMAARSGWPLVATLGAALMIVPDPGVTAEPTFADLQATLDRRGAVLEDVSCTDQDCLGHLGGAVLHVRRPRADFLNLSVDTINPDPDAFAIAAGAAIEVMTGLEQPEADEILDTLAAELERTGRAEDMIDHIAVSLRHNSAGHPLFVVAGSTGN